jgi:hypothetical protein
MGTQLRDEETGEVISREPAPTRAVARFSGPQGVIIEVRYSTDSPAPTQGPNSDRVLMCVQCHPGATYNVYNLNPYRRLIVNPMSGGQFEIVIVAAEVD